MGVRNCGELGLNLQKIVQRLMANDDLVKLLYYEDKDPLSGEALTKEQKEKEIYQKLIRITPQYSEDESNKSVLVLCVNKGSKIPGNKEFVRLEILIEVFVPFEQWLIKDTNLRPFAILGKIQEALEGKTINGLGKIEGGDFDLVNLSTKSSVYAQVFYITEYD